jgi:acetylornithine deacetylase
MTLKEGGGSKMSKNDFQENIFSRVDRHFDDQLDFLSQLVRIRSLVGQEGEGQQFYAQACRDLGLKVETFEVDKAVIEKHPAYIPIDLEYSGRPNVIARKPGSGGGRSLILNGHMDVVSPEP